MDNIILFILSGNLVLDSSLFCNLACRISAQSFLVIHSTHPTDIYMVTSIHDIHHIKTNVMDIIFLLLTCLTRHYSCAYAHGALT